MRHLLLAALFSLLAATAQAQQCRTVLSDGDNATWQSPCYDICEDVRMDVVTTHPFCISWCYVIITIHNECPTGTTLDVRYRDSTGLVIGNPGPWVTIATGIDKGSTTLETNGQPGTFLSTCGTFLTVFQIEALFATSHGPGGTWCQPGDVAVGQEVYCKECP